MDVNGMGNIEQELIELWNEKTKKMSAIQRIEWAMSNLPNNSIISSSFGIQSAVMLHMMSKIAPNIPVILADTGYLFPETYQYIEELTESLKLNLYIYQAQLSSEEQIIKYGKLWEQGEHGINKHYYINKVEPFERAMSDLNAQTWFSGVRAEQSSHRKKLAVVEQIRHHIKVHPIIDWNAIDIDNYITKNNLPIHPLKAQGYQSVGDMLNTHQRDNFLVDNIKQLCDNKRECGLHTLTE
jgi:phosphoadenosine phosphosulfate reductase